MANLRAQAAIIIRRVIEGIGTGDEKRLRRALHDAYPWGDRATYRYKIWLDEIKRQTEERKPTMTVAEAREMISEVLAGYFSGRLNISVGAEERLGRLCDELEKAAPLLDADTVTIREADTRFLRGLYRKISRRVHE